jgi:hypothetical protein
MTSIMDLHIVRTSVAYVRLQERETQRERETERDLKETERPMAG